MQKADLQPTDGADPDHVAVDETVIQLNDERSWCMPQPILRCRFLRIKLFSTRNLSITEMLLAGLPKKNIVYDATVLVNGASWLQAALHRTTSIAETKNMIIGTA